MDTSHMELMVPAGSFGALAAAIRAGADSVYFGVGKLNMRASGASNFAVGDLRKIVRLCRVGGVRSYLAANTIIYDEELPEVAALLREARDAGVSAVIAGDVAVMEIARELGLEVHVSVQANVSNVAALRAYARYADVVVLARELSLAQVAAVCRAVKDGPILGPSGRPIRVELFVHGALCVAVSGLCGMSLAAYNTSGNRGTCLQPCRRRYRVIDDETGVELAIENRYVMSPRDICLLPYLDRILAAGVSVLKIEGRGRKAHYVATTTRVYREALAVLGEGGDAAERMDGWMGALRQVYNRDFWMGGHYCGDPLHAWAGDENSQSTVRRVQLSEVTNYYARPGVVEFTLWQARLEEGEALLVEGPTTGAVEFVAANMIVDEQPSRVATKGAVVTLRTPARVRRRDKVFRLEPVDRAGPDAGGNG